MFSKRYFSIAGVAAWLIVRAIAPSHIAAASSHSAAPQWSVQVDKIGTGDVNIGPAFTLAIYENLVRELAKSKQFNQVLRSGDRTANYVNDLLILKTTVEAYTEGSETRRAVTTVSGATKLKVKTELCTRDGKVVLQRDLSGNVRFFGDNLRATHSLARNVAKTIKDSTLPEQTATGQCQGAS